MFLGFMRTFSEWKAAQIFGRLTYCAYLAHVSLMRLRAGRIRTPEYITEYLLVSYLIIKTFKNILNIF